MIVERMREVRAAFTVFAILAACTSPPAMAAPAAGGQPGLPEQLSVWEMFLSADWVVKAVMMGLFLASVATWTVLIVKYREFKRAMGAQRKALLRLEDARSLADAEMAVGNDAPVASAMLQATHGEITQSRDALHDADGLKERIASRLDRIEATAGRQMTRGTGALATIGATAPFVGLFGTVWGIMNSFVGIAAAQTTNLAVVAPGIAEALLATALGLVAAIPAVVIYNHFARQTLGYRALIADASAAVLRLVSRDLSRDALTPPALRAAE